MAGSPAPAQHTTLQAQTSTQPKLHSHALPCKQPQCYCQQTARCCHTHPYTAPPHRHILPCAPVANTTQQLCASGHQGFRSGRPRHPAELFEPRRHARRSPKPWLPMQAGRPGFTIRRLGFTRWYLGGLPDANGLPDCQAAAHPHCQVVQGQCEAQLQEHSTARHSTTWHSTAQHGHFQLA